MSCDTAVDQRLNCIGISVLCHPFIAKLKEQTRPKGVWFQARAAGRRPAATFLGGRLAKSAEEKRLVRDAALRLIGFGSDDDYRVTKTLQLVESELGDSVGLLAQGSWTLRSLAAILSAESTDLPEDLGCAFSQNRDVRVRRALASALASAEHRHGADAREVPSHDPRWSVRSMLRAATRPPD